MGHRNGGRINAANVNQHVVTARPSTPKAKKAVKKVVAPEPEKVQADAAETKTEEESGWPTVTPTQTPGLSKSD